MYINPSGRCKCGGELEYYFVEDAVAGGKCKECGKEIPLP